MGLPGQESQETGKGDGALPKGKVIALFRVIVVKVGADEAWGQAAEMLFMVDQPKALLGGGVTEVVPVAEGGSGQFLQDEFPEIVGGNFAGILATLQAQPDPQRRRFFPEAQEDFLHARPGLGEGLFHGADGVNFLPDIFLRADLSGCDESFQFPRPAAGAGGTDVENDQLGANGDRRLQSFQGVTLGKATGRFPGIGEFVGVGVGAEHLHRDGAKVVEDLDGGYPRFAVGGQDPGPEAVAGVVAEFDGGEAKVRRFAEKLVSLRDPVGVPAGGKGEIPHPLIFLEKRKRAMEKRKVESGRRKAEEGWVGV